MTKTNNLISICIPTYNRSDFLIKGLTVWSKFAQKYNIEIVIDDDASTDNTQEEVKKFIASHKKMNIVYHKHPKRQYFDKMVLSIVKYAHGEFCWLISDDDLPQKDSIEKLIKIINKYPNTALIHLNYSRFDNILKKVTAKKMVGSINKDVQFTNSDNFIFMPVEKSYFDFLGTNIITMSTDVVNRKQWLKSIKGMNKFVKYNFMHCFVIAKMIKANPSVYYVAKPIVEYLSNNHRVWPNDIWKDYNKVFLNYLIELGFDKKKVLEMRRKQKKYEQREGIMKHPVLKYIYKLLSPIYSIYQNILAKFVF